MIVPNRVSHSEDPLRQLRLPELHLENLSRTLRSVSRPSAEALPEPFPASLGDCLKRRVHGPGISTPGGESLRH